MFLYKEFDCIIAPRQFKCYNASWNVQFHWNKEAQETVRYIVPLLPGALYFFFIFILAATNRIPFDLV